MHRSRYWLAEIQKLENQSFRKKNLISLDAIFLLLSEKINIQRKKQYCHALIIKSGRDKHFSDISFKPSLSKLSLIFEQLCK